MERPFRLVPPPAASRAFLRPRLHERLAARFERRAIVVNAGAGFGKTTLLVHALHENRLDARGRDIWLGCEAADSSASTLLGALLTSVRTTTAGSGNVSAGSDQPTVHDVCEEVWSLAPEPICFVLDDVHEIEPHSPGERVLAELIDQLPQNGHVVLAGRRHTDVSITRLVAQGRADVLTEDDLRLDEAEVAQLASAHGLEPSALGDVGGWPALVELRASARSGSDAQFVAEEVMAAWSPAERRDVAVLCVMQGGSAEVAAEVLQEFSGRPLDLDRLRRIPLVAVDAAGTIRPHSLWDELLASELTAEEVVDVRRRAALVLTRRGQPAAAFELLAAAGQWDSALPALFEACNDQRTPPWSDVMDRWHRLVPVQMSGEPEVAYVRGMVVRGKDPWAPGALEELERAYLAFRERGDVVRELGAMVRASFIALVRGDRAWAAAARDRIDAFAAAGLPMDVMRAFNRAVRALIDDLVDDVLDAASGLVDVEPRLRHFRGFFEACAFLARGDARAAIAPADAAAEAARPVVPAAGTAWAAMLPVAARLAAGRLSEVGSLVDPGSRFANAERVPTLAVDALARANRGDVAGARADLGAIDALLPADRPRPFVDGFAAIAAAAVHVAEGDEVAAAEELTRRLGSTIEPVGSGTAARWFPAHPYLLHEGVRAWLDRSELGATGAAIVEGCRSLLAARRGEPVGNPPAIAGDLDALVAAFGVRLSVELVVRTTRDVEAAVVVRDLAHRWPVPTRAVLRALAKSAEPRVVRRATALTAAVPIPPAERVQLAFLGPSLLSRDGEPIDDPNWRRTRVRQLLACLVVHRTLRRQRLADLLWPDATEEASSANLRMTLSYVQSLMEPGRERGDAPWFIRQDAGVLQLREADELDVDVWELDRDLDRARALREAAQPSAELDALLRAIGRWRGEPFTELGTADWLIAERQRVLGRFLAASERAGALLVAAGRVEEAEHVVERGLHAEPWNESLHRVAIMARRAADDLPGARRAYERCELALAELGARPTASTNTLMVP